VKLPQEPLEIGEQLPLTLAIEGPVEVRSDIDLVDRYLPRALQVWGPDETVPAPDLLGVLLFKSVDRCDVRRRITEKGETALNRGDLVQN
jgi:hypothetical protein